LGTAVERPTLLEARYGHRAEGLDSSFWPNDGRFPTLLYFGGLSVGFPVVGFRLMPHSGEVKSTLRRLST
jgi:hypothetical protein